MRTALVSGFWGQNIGNAFFNLGGKHLLEESGLNPFFIQDMPAYATFRNEKKGSYKNSYPTLENLDFDLLVLQGPLFTRNFGNIWLDTLRTLRTQGKRWAILGGAFRNYSGKELSIAAEVVRAVPPDFISTRDSVSHGMLEGAGLSLPLRNGIDSAFFLPETYDPPTSKKKSLVLCFDHFGEPEIFADVDGGIELQDGRYRLLVDRRVDSMANKSKAHAIAYNVLSRYKSRPSEIGGLKVIRPDHRTNPHLPIKIYRDPNGLASDEPWTYLAIYNNSALTISDRVHACVATLAYGGQAMLHNPKTKRSALFADVEAGTIEDCPTRLNEDLRKKQYVETLEFLSDVAFVEQAR